MFDQFFNSLNEKIEEINKKIDNIQVNKEIEIFSTNDVMKILKVNRNTANELFTRPDFPKIKRNKKQQNRKTSFL